VARAVLEAIAFQTRDVAEAMAQDTGVALGKLRVDGGVSKNDLLMQIQVGGARGRCGRFGMRGGGGHRGMDERGLCAAAARAVHRAGRMPLVISQS